jgi:predicted permease
MLDFWAPVTLSAQFQERSEFGVVGRLNRGLSVRQAKAGLALWAQRFTSGYPDVEKATTIHFQSRATSIPLSPNIVLISSPILVAFALVLLIACANVANMMLARAMSRQREIGIRLSLGAARSRLIRQLLTESVLLALPAAALGFVVSQTTIELATRAMFATIPAEFADFIRVAPMSPDIRVFGFMLAAAVVSAPLFGLAPALQATRSNVMQASRGDFTNEFRPTRLRNSLVVGQITVCLVLLISAGVLLRSAQRMQTLDIGLRTRDVIEIEFQKKFRSRVLAQISSESFVRMFAAAKDPPLDGAFPKVPVRTTDGEDFTQASSNHVSPEYFTVLEIPILRGRNFTKEEANSAAPVVIVSQATAQRLWPGREALGQSLHIRHDQLASVIGISRDVVSGFVGNGVDGTCIYFPTSPRASGNALLVAVTGDPEIARRKLDADLTAIDSGVVEQIHKLQEFVAGQLYPFQVAYWVCSAIGALALLLTLSGIYGVLSYAVSQRTKEIGIRMAMGATTPSVIGLVLNQSMKLAVTGVVLGAILAAGVSRIFASLLAMMNTFDGLAYGASMLLVLAACAAAAYFPSRKAVRIDPVSTLRCD